MMVSNQPFRNNLFLTPAAVAEEKAKALEALGARVEKVRPASIVDKKQVSHFPSIFFFLLDG